MEWENNLESMLTLLESVQVCVRGVVRCGDTGHSLDKAQVTVIGREKPVVTTMRSVTIEIVNLYLEQNCVF